MALFLDVTLWFSVNQNKISVYIQISEPCMAHHVGLFYSSLLFMAKSQASSSVHQACNSFETAHSSATSWFAGAIHFLRCPTDGSTMKDY